MTSKSLDSGDRPPLPLLPVEIGRLVYTYLGETNCPKTRIQYGRENVHLSELISMVNKNLLRDINFLLNGMGLEDILKEYILMKYGIEKLCRKFLPDQSALSKLNPIHKLKKLSDQFENWTFQTQRSTQTTQSWRSRRQSTRSKELTSEQQKELEIANKKILERYNKPQKEMQQGGLPKTTQFQEIPSPSKQIQENPRVLSIIPDILKLQPLPPDQLVSYRSTEKDFSNTNSKLHESGFRISQCFNVQTTLTKVPVQSQDPFVLSNVVPSIPTSHQDPIPGCSRQTQENFPVAQASHPRNVPEHNKEQNCDILNNTPTFRINPDLSHLNVVTSSEELVNKVETDMESQPPVATSSIKNTASTKSRKNALKSKAPTKRASHPLSMHETDDEEVKKKLQLLSSQGTNEDLLSQVVGEPLVNILAETHDIDQTVETFISNPELFDSFNQVMEELARSHGDQSANLIEGDAAIEKVTIYQADEGAASNQTSKTHLKKIDKVSAYNVAFQSLLNANLRVPPQVPSFKNSTKLSTLDLVHKFLSADKTKKSKKASTKIQKPKCSPVKRIIAEDTPSLSKDSLISCRNAETAKPVENIIRFQIRTPEKVSQLATPKTSFENILTMSENKIQSKTPDKESATRSVISKPAFGPTSFQNIFGRASKLTFDDLRSPVKSLPHLTVDVTPNFLPQEEESLTTPPSESYVSTDEVTPAKRARRMANRGMQNYWESPSSTKQGYTPMKDPGTPFRFQTPMKPSTTTFQGIHLLCTPAKSSIAQATGTPRQAKTPREPHTEVESNLITQSKNYNIEQPSVANKTPRKTENLLVEEEAICTPLKALREAVRLATPSPIKKCFTPQKKNVPITPGKWFCSSTLNSSSKTPGKSQEGKSQESLFTPSPCRRRPITPAKWYTPPQNKQTPPKEVDEVQSKLTQRRDESLVSPHKRLLTVGEMSKNFFQGATTSIETRSQTRSPNKAETQGLQSDIRKPSPSKRNVTPQKIISSPRKKIARNIFSPRDTAISPSKQVKHPWSKTSDENLVAAKTSSSHRKTSDSQNLFSSPRKESPNKNLAGCGRTSASPRKPVASPSKSASKNPEVETAKNSRKRKSPSFNSDCIDVNQELVPQLASISKRAKLSQQTLEPKSASQGPMSLPVALGLVPSHKNAFGMSVSKIEVYFTQAPQRKRKQKST